LRGESNAAVPTAEPLGDALCTVVVTVVIIVVSFVFVIEIHCGW
jgi:hypothetical protein